MSRILELQSGGSTSDSQLPKQLYIDLYIFICIYISKKYILIIKKKYGQVFLKVSTLHVHIYILIQLALAEWQGTKINKYRYGR